MGTDNSDSNMWMVLGVVLGSLNISVKGGQFWVAVFECFTEGSFWGGF